MVDTWVWSNPQAWFLPFDLAVGIIFAWLFTRMMIRKYAEHPWLKTREDKWNGFFLNPFSLSYASCLHLAGLDEAGRIMVLYRPTDLITHL